MQTRSSLKPAEESRVEMTEVVLPEDTNQYGHAWGGRVMALIDKAAAIAAVRHCRANVVTASVDSLIFRAPVKLGHILKLYALVNAAFHTSMEVGVRVVSEDPLSGLQAHCCSAFVTMVALNSTGHPTPVPGLLPAGREGRRRQREARRRRQARLALRDHGRRRASRS
ncbi:MAG TPA: acyl-CoA thioesterase [Candidatus Polarisedimenticolia bacterium]|nr:acyl-CoA thioesterase [Candidatus Polarisedimenticolia bacterium]